MCARLMRTLASSALWSVCLLVFSVLSASAQQPDNWSTFHHDIYRTGYSSSAIPWTMSLLWSYQLAGRSRGIFSSPAVVDGSVYFTARDRRLYCLDADTGFLQWKSEPLGDDWDTDYPTGFDGNKWDSSPAVAEGMVYVGARDGSCYAFSTSGYPAWATPLPTDQVVVASPLYVDGKLFVASGDLSNSAKLWWLNPGDGLIVASVLLGSNIEVMVASPAMFSPNRVLVAAGINQLVVEVLPKELHIEAFSYDTACFVRSSPAVSNSRIYLGDGSASWPSGLACLDSVLRPEWTAGDAGEWTCGTAAVHLDRIWVPGGTGGIGLTDIYCVEDMGSSGVIVWEMNLDADRLEGKPVSPAVAGNSVFMAVTRPSSSPTIRSVLVRLNAENGDIIQEFDLGPGKVLSSPAIWDGKVYIGTADGRLLCFG